MATSGDRSEASSDVIRRVLFACTPVHVYTIPPLTSAKGYAAAAWTDHDNARRIFTARIRVMETSGPLPDPSETESLHINIVLEDPKTGELFAGAPFTDKSVVEVAIDSSRFFAIRVVGAGDMKAVLGIGFEDRSQAIDFGICIQDCRKIFDSSFFTEDSNLDIRRGGSVAGPRSNKRDWSLKKGEVIKVDVGGKSLNEDEQPGRWKTHACESGEEALFSIKPPPVQKLSRINGGKTIPIHDAGTAKDTSGTASKNRENTPSAFKPDPESLGFDDGEFGEFQ